MNLRHSLTLIFLSGSLLFGYSYVVAQRPPRAPMSTVQAKTKYFLIANKDEKDLEKRFAAGGLQRVLDKADADFTIEYLYRVSEVKLEPMVKPGDPVYQRRKGAMMSVYIVRGDGKRAIVWQYYSTVGSSSSGRNFLPRRDLPKRFLADRAAGNDW